MDGHDYFSNKNEPKTSASKGELQKHSIASRGVQTIGLPKVLIRSKMMISAGAGITQSLVCEAMKPP